MSEFQYYEFRTIDKPLSTHARREIGSWSRRTSPSSNKAIFTYHYGNFPMNEEDVLIQYFDIFLYFANWGTKRLSFKFPESSVDFEEMRKYLISFEDWYDNYLKIEKIGNFVLVHMNYNEDELDGWYDDEENSLDSFVLLRNDILNGDYRPLFLMWLKIYQLCFTPLEFNDERFINGDMIPPDLSSLNASHHELIDFFQIDIDWVNAMSKFSPKSDNENLDYLEKLKDLSPNEKNDILVRLLNHEPNLSIKLKIKLKLNTKITIQNKVYLSNFLEQVDHEIENRISTEKAQKHQAYLKRMYDIAQNEQKILQSIEKDIIYASGKSYDKALESLIDLRDLAHFNKTETQFNLFINKLLKKYGRKRALVRRLQDARFMA